MNTNTHTHALSPTSWNTIANNSLKLFSLQLETTMMHNFTIKLLTVMLLVWFRLISQNIGVNCNWNRLHNLLMRNTYPCAINSLCMCTNSGNSTNSYKISCHDVWFYKFTGKLFPAFFLSRQLVTTFFLVKTFDTQTNVKCLLFLSVRAEYCYRCIP